MKNFKSFFVLLIFSVVLIVNSTTLYAQPEVETIASRAGNQLPYYITGQVWLGDLPPSDGMDSELVIVDLDDPQYAEHGVLEAIEVGHIDTLNQLQYYDSLFTEWEFQRLLDHGYHFWEDRQPVYTVARMPEDTESRLAYMNNNDQPEMFQNSPVGDSDLIQMAYQYYFEESSLIFLWGKRLEDNSLMQTFRIENDNDLVMMSQYSTRFPNLQCLLATPLYFRYDPYYYLFFFEPPSDSLSGWQLRYREVGDTINTNLELELEQGITPNELFTSKSGSYFNGLAWTQTDMDGNTGIGFHIRHKDSTGVVQIENELKNFSAFGSALNVFPYRSYLVWTETTADSIFLKRTMIDSNPSDVQENIVEQPGRFALSKTYPNPFNSSTRFSFTVPAKGNVLINVFDLLGREIAVLHEGQALEGQHGITWNVHDLPTGTYFIQMKSGDYKSTVKTMLLK